MLSIQLNLLKQALLHYIITIVLKYPQVGYNQSGNWNSILNCEWPLYI